MALFTVPILVLSGVIAVSGAVGLYYLSWTVESVEEIVEETSGGLNVVLIGAGLFIVAMAIGRIGGIGKAIK